MESGYTEPGLLDLSLVGLGLQLYHPNPTSPRQLRLRIDYDPSYGYKRLRVTGEELVKPPNSIWKLKEVEFLDMSPGHKCDTCFKYQLVRLPAEVSKLVNLRVLCLDTNKLSELPHEVGLLCHLERLVISNNMLTKLPASLQELDQLVSLHLANNHLTEIPKVVFLIKNLQFLDACDNRITYLAPEIGLLTNLETLLLMCNLLESIPDSIGECFKLQTLWLGTNRLKELPRNIGNLFDLNWARSSSSCNLEGNPLKKPPIKICKKGPLAIEKYFRNKELMEKILVRETPTNTTDVEDSVTIELNPKDLDETSTEKQKKGGRFSSGGKKSAAMKYPKNNTWITSDNHGNEDNAIHSPQLNSRGKWMTYPNLAKGDSNSPYQLNSRGIWITSPINQMNGEIESPSRVSSNAASMVAASRSNSEPRSAYSLGALRQRKSGVASSRRSCGKTIKRFDLSKSIPNSKNTDKIGTSRASCNPTDSSPVKNKRTPSRYSDYVKQEAWDHVTTSLLLSADSGHRGVESRHDLSTSTRSERRIMPRTPLYNFSFNNSRGAQILQFHERLKLYDSVYINHNNNDHTDNGRSEGQQSTYILNNPGKGINKRSINPRGGEKYIFSLFATSPKTLQIPKRGPKSPRIVKLKSRTRSLDGKLFDGHALSCAGENATDDCSSDQQDSFEEKCYKLGTGFYEKEYIKDKLFSSCDGEKVRPGSDEKTKESKKIGLPIIKTNSKQKSPQPPKQENSPHTSKQKHSSNSPQPLKQKNSPHPPNQENSPHPPKQENSPHPPKQENSPHPPKQENSPHPSKQDYSPKQEKSQHNDNSPKSPEDKYTPQPPKEIPLVNEATENVLHDQLEITITTSAPARRRGYVVEKRQMMKQKWAKRGKSGTFSKCTKTSLAVEKRPDTALTNVWQEDEASRGDETIDIIGSPRVSSKTDLERNDSINSQQCRVVTSSPCKGHRTSDKKEKNQNTSINSARKGRRTSGKTIKKDRKKISYNLTKNIQNSPLKSAPKSSTKSTSNGPTKSTPNSPTKSTPNSPTKSTPNRPTKTQLNSLTKSKPDSPTKSTRNSPTKSAPNSPTNMTKYNLNSLTKSEPDSLSTSTSTSPTKSAQNQIFSSMNLEKGQHVMSDDEESGKRDTFETRKTGKDTINSARKSPLKNGSKTGDDRPVVTGGQESVMTRQRKSASKLRRSSCASPHRDSSASNDQSTKHNKSSRTQTPSSATKIKMSNSEEFELARDIFGPVLCRDCELKHLIQSYHDSIK